MSSFQRICGLPLKYFLAHDIHSRAALLHDYILSKKFIGYVSCMICILSGVCVCVCAFVNFNSAYLRTIEFFHFHKIFWRYAYATISIKFVLSLLDQGLNCGCKTYMSRPELLAWYNSSISRKIEVHETIFKIEETAKKKEHFKFKNVLTRIYSYRKIFQRIKH